MHYNLAAIFFILSISERHILPNLFTRLHAFCPAGDFCYTRSNDKVGRCVWKNFRNQGHAENSVMINKFLRIGKRLTKCNTYNKIWIKLHFGALFESVARYELLFTVRPQITAPISRDIFRLNLVRWTCTKIGQVIWMFI